MGFYKGNKVSQESAVLDSFKTDIKMLPAKTNKIMSIKDLTSQALSDRLNGNLMLFKGKLINFKFFINRYKETISNLNRMLSNIDKYVKMDSEDSYKLILQNIAHVEREFNQYTLGEKELDTMVRSDNVDGIYLKTYAMYTTIKKDNKNQNARLVIDFATFGYDTSNEGGIYGFMEESDDWVTTVTSINITSAGAIVSGTIDLNKLYDAVLDAYNYYKKIDVIKLKPFKTGTTEYKIQYVISDVVDRTVNAYKNLLDNIISIYKELANLDISVSTESENTELSSNVDIPSEVDPELAVQDLQDATQEINASIDAAEESEALEADANDELEAIEDRLKSGDPIDPVEVAIVNESIQNYCKAMGIERKNASISLEGIKTDSRTTMEGLKVELEDLVTEIKNFAFIIWRQIVKLFSWLYEAIKNVFNDKAKTLESKYNALLKLSNDMDKNKEATSRFLEKYPTRFTGVYNVFPNVDKFAYISKLYRSIDRNAMSLANYITGRNNDNDDIQKMNPLGSLISNLKEINPDFIRSANIKDAYNMAVVGLHTSGPTIEIRFASLTGEMNTTILTRHEYPSSLIISPSYLGVYINAYLAAYKLGKETADNIDRKFGIKANNDPRTENKIILTACRLLVKTFVGMHTTVMNDLYYFLKAASDVVIKTYK